MLRKSRLTQSSLEDDTACSEQMSAISVLLEAGEELQTRQALSQFAERFQTDARAHAFAAVCFSQLGDVPNAMAENAIAMALCPTDPTSLDRLAGLLRQKGHLQAADQVQSQTLVAIEAKTVRRIHSPWYVLVAALTGVSITFAPLFLYMAGGQAGKNGMSHLLNPWVLLCFATIYCIPGFYMSVASPVIAQVLKTKKARAFLTK